MVVSLDTNNCEISALFGRLDKGITPLLCYQRTKKRKHENKSEWGQWLSLFITLVLRRTVTKIYPFKAGFLLLTKLLGILAVKA